MTTDTLPITVTAYRWVPAFAQGLVRDLRVRWALEEAGLPYRVELIDHKEKDSAEYLLWQPFGQVPAYEQDGIKLFESGAIVLHIAEQSDVLMPPDAAGRARVRTWLFAALNSIEPSVQELTGIDLFHGDEAWAGQRRPQVEGTVRKRLGALAAWLGEREYLETRYTAADLLMVTVLRNLRHTDLLAQFPTLKAHSERCEARPAFQKALRDQMADFVPDPVAA
ncbi:glutathione S-transferase [Rhodanobacter sp. Root627]|uniref:glutathione S-transferase family protein n=1 Tax=Rhodanobacter sp. Root627 TaxID=1736572 RepID=UPI0006F98066|nr:glutathione S-transferase family protein [Rhodanobacter sp. Root627]KRA33188.1 glutathione S-transferase [Rhodanobacter sp. Root627]